MPPIPPQFLKAARISLDVVATDKNEAIIEVAGILEETRICWISSASAGS